MTCFTTDKKNREGRDTLETIPFVLTQKGFCETQPNLQRTNRVRSINALNSQGRAVAFQGKNEGLEN